MSMKEEKGDLISREALKKALKSNCDLCHDKNTNWCEHCCPLNDFEDLIDNAPTVEPKLKDDIIEAFNLITDQEFEHSDSFWIETPKGKKIEFEKKRPQGEWIDIEKEGRTGDGRTFHYPITVCSVCKEPTGEFSNFCSNCGADMRGGGE